ncbi:hypothetical protein FH603_5370 [Spirosoma sp. LMG 31447]|uniref:Cupin n=1 Tax=Spirosoma utsteinense TaxID=2585773 RepID=A0ABR6WE56_9BACT|nr:hypothetical protein [Spirosoma utsteinense]
MEQIEELTELKSVTLKDRVSQGDGDWPYAE